MIWVRGNRRIGAWLGLLALALQLILSFGHIHLSDIAIPQAAAADAAAAPQPGTPAHPPNPPPRPQRRTPARRPTATTARMTSARSVSRSISPPTRWRRRRRRWFSRSFSHRRGFALSRPAPFRPSGIYFSRRERLRSSFEPCG